MREGWPGFAGAFLEPKFVILFASPHYPHKQATEKQPKSFFQGLLKAAKGMSYRGKEKANSSGLKA
jgi:arginine utilization protein RocB